MNKKYLIIIIALVAVLLVGIGAVLLIGNKHNKTGTINSNNNADSNISSNNKSEIMSEDFKFILDMSKLTDDWWNSINKEWETFEYTNKKVYDIRWEKVLGNPDGQLQICPVGFTENIKVGYESITARDEYYSLTIKDNEFLIPQQIKVINDDVNSVSAELDFYVLANDLWFYNVSLNVDNNPADIELSEGNWKTVYNEKNGYIDVDSYYPINVDYCLHISYPVSTQDGGTKIEKDVLKELADNATSLVSLNKINDTTNVDDLSFRVKHNDIELDENTIVLMKNMKMKSWHSGAGDVVGNISEGDTVITAYNSNNDWTYITEYKKDKDMDYYLSYLDLAMKGYNYNGRDIYITYYTDEAIDTYKGKYHSIMFKINDIWYDVAGIKAIDPNQTDVNTWIKTMCDGVISFK